VIDVIMNIWKIVKPGWSNMLLFAFFFITSVLVVQSYAGTSKVSWDIETGWPVAYLSLMRYHGPCTSSKVCDIIAFQGLEPFPLLLDASIWYLTACIASYGLSLVIHKAKVHAIVTSCL
jgi:hypothetical protein